MKRNGPLPLLASLAILLLAVVLVLWNFLQRPSSEPPIPWAVYNAAATNAFRAGRYVEAECLGNLALHAAEIFDSDKTHRPASLLALAGLYAVQGHYEKAESFGWQALTLQEKAHGPDDPGLVESLNRLAEIYIAQQKYEPAEPLYRRSLTLQEKALGPENPDLTTGLDRLVWLYNALGRYAEAEPFCLRAIKIKEKTLGPQHPEVAAELVSCAALLKALHRPAEAEEMQKRAEAIRQHTPP